MLEGIRLLHHKKHQGFSVEIRVLEGGVVSMRTTQTLIMGVLATQLLRDVQMMDDFQIILLIALKVRVNLLTFLCVIELGTQILNFFKHS